MNQVCTAENLTAIEDWDLLELNRILLNRTAEQRVDWAVNQFPGQLHYRQSEHFYGFRFR